MKKTFSLLLVICLVLSSVFCYSVSSAAGDTVYDAYIWHNSDYVIFQYTLDNSGNATIIRAPYIWDDELLGDWAECHTIPSYLDGHKVVAIGDNAYGVLETKKVIVPSTISKIGDYAFCYSNMSNIVLPDTIESIGVGAFQECFNLTSISIPQRVKELKKYTFCDCYKLNTVKLPDGLETIGDYCFAGSNGMTGVTNISIPDSVRTIGKYAFSLSNLKSIKIPASVTSIGAYAFSQTKLSSVVLPNKLTSLGKYCFERTPLKSIVLPNSLKYLPEGCFADCTKLTAINLGKGITSINYCALANTSIKNIVIPKQVSKINPCFYSYTWDCHSQISNILVATDNKTFSSYKGVLYNKKKTAVLNYPRCKTDYVLAKGVKSVGNYAFAYSKLKKITLPSTVSAIGTCAFQGSSLVQISIPGKVKVIPKNCFVACTSLKAVKVPNSIVKIEEGSLMSNQILTLDLPNSLQIMERFCLGGDMVGLMIPPSVKSITGYLKGGECTAFDYIAGYKGTTAQKYWKKYEAQYGTKFIVAPAIPKFTLVKSPAKSKLQLKWKKASDAHGYQLQISTSSTMSENTKQVTIKGNKNVSKNIAKLKSGQVLYIQVRSYRVQKVKGVNRVIYGAWSKTAKVKIK